MRTKSATHRSLTGSRRAMSRATKAIAEMRKGRSLTHAARLARTSPQTVKKYASKRLERTKVGRFVVRRADQRVRSMRFLSVDGIVAVDVRGSDSASRVGEYWNAVHQYLKTGDATKFKRFRGKYLQSGGKRRPFITDLDLLERLAHAGEVKFEDIYQLST